jgi:hypothetical protein
VGERVGGRWGICFHIIGLVSFPFSQYLEMHEEMLKSCDSRYHEQMPQIIHEYLDGDDFQGGNTKGMPLEASSLINDTQYLSLDIQPNKKYLLRIAGVCAHLPHILSFGKNINRVDVHRARI